MKSTLPSGGKRVGVVQLIDIAAWDRAYAVGATPARLPYGLEELERHGHRVSIYRPPSRSIPRLASRVVDAIAYRAGLSVQDAWQAVAAARSSDTVVAIFEDQAIALGLLRAHGWWPRHNPRLVVLACWLAQRAVDWPSAQRGWLGEAMRQADAVVCLSENQPLVVHQRLSVECERLHTTVLGVHSDYYLDVGEPRGTHVLSVGGDTGRDYPTLFAAMSGSGIQTRVIAPAANLAGIDRPAEVEWLGTTDNAGYRRELNKAGLVVIASHPLLYPTGQTVLLEAMAAGCACVVSDGPAIRQYVEDGRTAVLVRPNDPVALRRAAVELLDDDARRRRLGGAARAAAESQFTPTQMWAPILPLL